MLRAIEGVYRNGRIELLEKAEAAEGSRVIVTFLAGGAVDLQERGFTEREAADLRFRLQAFAEDWERPEMDVYDAL